MYDILIAGAGVIGGMIARELSKFKLKVCLVEKGNDVSVGASMANSGIIHGGYDPEPDTLKAKMNASGIEKLYKAADELNVPYQRNGSMVCAFDSDEENEIYKLYERGIKNGIENLRILGGDEARKIEPNLSENIMLVLHVPNAGIICPYKLTIAAIGNAIDNGVDLVRNFEIVDIEKNGEFYKLISADKQEIVGKYLINCAGCFSDKIAKLAGDNSFEIIPRKGEYLLLDKQQGEIINHTIFQVPSKEGKGILVSPTVDGNLLTGPTAVLVDSAYNNDITTFGIDVIKKLAKKSVPSVDFSQVITSFAGVRSSEKNGDFIIKASDAVDRLINVAAIDSPGLTSCVAIAEHVVGILDDIGVSLENKSSWNGTREDSDFFAKLNDTQKDEFIKRNPDYGKVVCRCEGITKGEIKAVIHKNPVPLDLDGIKRRTRSGMGRCQGGFCTPYLMQILSEENDVDICSITKKGGKSNITIGRI